MQGQRKLDLISVDELARLLFASRVYVCKKLLRKHVLRPVFVIRGHKHVLRSKRRRIAANASELLGAGCASWRVCLKRWECTPEAPNC